MSSPRSSWLMRLEERGSKPERETFSFMRATVDSGSIFCFFGSMGNTLRLGSYT